MQGKRPFYLMLITLISLNLVATNLQAHEVQADYKAHINYNLPILYEESINR